MFEDYGDYMVTLWSCKNKLFNAVNAVKKKLNGAVTFFCTYFCTRCRCRTFIDMFIDSLI
jgi:hypothetical protein